MLLMLSDSQLEFNAIEEKKSRLLQNRLIDKARAPTKYRTAWKAVQVYALQIELNKELREQKFRERFDWF